MSNVERIAHGDSPLQRTETTPERIGVIVVPSFPALGKLVALRFVEWVQQHPGGVVSLPTGKTPEHFIKWVERFATRWEDRDVQQTLENSGVDPAKRPDLRSLHFVQIDEFYPIDPAQHNSFHHYVNQYYLGGFGLDPARALLMNCAEIGLTRGQTLAGVWPEGTVDLSLRYRAPQSRQERIQQDVLRRIDDWCCAYEDRIRALGGIGFFLGGIGPDGHIGFNVRGSDHHSTTRLTPTNYETQAAAASDLGGIEISRKRLVITIGLATITHHPDCTAIVMAAGEAKARVVARAIESEPTVVHPATALQKLPNARFYLTRGAAAHLSARRLHALAATPTLAEEQIETILIDLALRQNKRLVDLSAQDVASDPAGAILLQSADGQNLPALTTQVRDGLVQRIEAGAERLAATRFLHTEPHHDDLMLGYLPGIVRNIRDASNEHHFATLTSGFTAVTNDYLADRLRHLLEGMDSSAFLELAAEGYFEPSYAVARNRDLWQYLDGVAAQDDRIRDEGAARRLARNLAEIHGTSRLADLADSARRILEYLASAYPGKKDPPDVQHLKGMCREWEVETLWGYFGWNTSHVHHLRLGFYQGDIFTEEPTEDRDVPPVVDLLRATRPDVLSVALDPEGAGPDTHYKVLQAVAAALQRMQESGEPTPRTIWGYRNVWFRFHPAETNVFVPVSLNMFAIMDNAFRNTFISQKQASFPSYEHDGPFCELAQKIQVEQYAVLKTCLGREWFQEHPSPLLRAARGFVFLKAMDLPTFFTHVREIRRRAEEAC